MDDEIEFLYRVWTASHTDKALRLCIHPKRLGIVVSEGLAPTTCEWSQIANDIGNCMVVENNDERHAGIIFRGCVFQVATSSCPGWQALLEQLNRIAAYAPSWLIYFQGCSFASEDMRQSIAQAVGQLNSAHVLFHGSSLVQPAFFQSEQMPNRLRKTLIAMTDGERGQFNVSLESIENNGGRLQLTLSNAQPRNRQWQLISAITANSITNNGDPIDLCFKLVKFRHSAGLDIFLETMTRLGMKTGRQCTTMEFCACQFLDNEAIHSIGTEVALNKAVHTVKLYELDGQPLCDVVDLLAQSATLKNVKFGVPPNAEHQDCICKSLAASTGLISVKLLQASGANHDDTNYTEFVYVVRTAVVAAAYKTRAKYREWFILPVQALPYLCEYVQFGMPRLTVTAQSTMYGQEICLDEAGGDDPYRLTVLYDMLKSRSMVLHDFGKKSAAVVDKLPTRGKRKLGG